MADERQLTVSALDVKVPIATVCKAHGASFKRKANQATLELQDVRSTETSYGTLVHQLKIRHGVGVPFISPFALLDFAVTLPLSF